MKQNVTEKHFLFHIFRVDKEENPMPLEWVRRLRDKLRRLYGKDKEIHG